MATCPTPQKIAHDSMAAAIVHREKLEIEHGIDLTLKPYLCTCGKWHIGHQTRHTRLARRTTPKPKRRKR